MAKQNNKLDFRDASTIPTRSCGKTYTGYRRYKKYLISDFKNRCGYCHSSDTWHGGSNHYHIDHFAPKKQFPHLETDYNNLVYSCPLCNLAKSNKWPSNSATNNIVNGKGFLDPCNTNYNQYFYRNDEGYIYANNSSVAQSMINELNLNLEIHSITWQLSRLELIIDQYVALLENAAIDDKVREKAEKVHYTLVKVFYEYFKKLRDQKK